MRIIVLVLLLVFMTNFAFADVTAEIVDITKDKEGNIRVWTQYKIDGIEAKSRYPKIDGKSVWCVRYQALNFANMTDIEIKKRILEDLTQHCKTLIRKTFIKKTNEDIYSNHLSDIKGSKVKETETKILLDSNGDGTNDTIWTIHTDGSKSVTTP